MSNRFASTKNNTKKVKKYVLCMSACDSDIGFVIKKQLKLMLNSIVHNRV